MGVAVENWETTVRMTHGHGDPEPKHNRFNGAWLVLTLPPRGGCVYGGCIVRAGVPP